MRLIQGGINQYTECDVSCERDDDVSSTSFPLSGVFRTFGTFVALWM